MVHLDVEECSEELLRQQSYAIKNQLGHPKPPTRGFGTQNTPIGGYFACSSLVLYGIRIVVFCIPKPQVGGFGCPSWFIYGIRLLAKQFLGTFLDIEVDQSEVRCLELCLYGIKELTTQISTTDP